MENSKATDTLKFLAIHNSWRRGDETFEMQNPAEIGAAIDDAVNLLRKYDELEKENKRLRTSLAFISSTLGEDSDMSQAECMEKSYDYAYAALYPKNVS